MLTAIMGRLVKLITVCWARLRIARLRRQVAALKELRCRLEQ
jgi:hypothetical protein